MYKIYVNETPLILIQSDKLEEIKHRHSNELIVAYPGKSKFLLNYLDMLEKTMRFDRVIIHHHDYKLLKKDFLGLFQTVFASGGIVLNKSGKLLIIFRKGYWDLPKGKIEPGEKKKKAAIREVIEETGLKSVKINKKIGVTYHTYKSLSRTRNIKKTYWYLMQSKSNKLVPQIEENIEKAEWINILDLLQSDRKIYKNIVDILNQYLKEKEQK